MRLEITAPLEEVIAAYRAKPIGKVSTLWRPDHVNGKVAVIQSEEYSLLLQAWSNVTLLLEEIAPGTTVAEVKIHVGGGGLMKVSYGSLKKMHDRLLKAFRALKVSILDP